MDFERSYLFRNATLISCPLFSSKLDSPVIKTLERHECLTNVLITGKSNFDERNLQLVRVAFVKSNFLHKPYFNFQAKTTILTGIGLHFGFMIAERDCSELTTATKYMWYATLSRACLNLSHFHVSIKMTPHFETYVLSSSYTALILDRAWGRNLKLRGPIVT